MLPARAGGPPFDQAEPTFGARAGLAAVAAAPLFCTTLCHDPFVVPKFLPLAIGAVLLWIGYLRGAAPGGNALAPGIAAFGAAAILSTIGSVDIPASLFGPHRGQFHALLPIALCALIYMGVARSELTREQVVSAVLLGAIPVALYALLQAAHWDEPLAFSIQDGRVGGTFGSPIFLGAYLGLVLPLAWHFLFKDGWERTLGFLAMVLALGALNAARSRGGFAAGASGIVAYEAIRSGKAVAFTLVLLALMFAVMVFPKSSASDRERVEIWRAALAAWRDHPLLGYGPDTFGLAFRRHMTPAFVAAEGNDLTIQLSAHNDLLQVAATMGAVGLAAYTFLLSRLCTLAKQAVAVGTGWAGAAAIGAAVALFVQGKVNPVPTAVIAVAAALLGACDRPVWRPMPTARAAGSWLGLGLSVLLLAPVLMLVRAERLQKYGEVLRAQGDFIGWAQAYNKAAQVDPWDMHYTLMQADRLQAILPGLSLKDQGKLVDQLVIMADRAVRIHPQDSAAHEILGLALYSQALQKGHRQRAADITREYRTAVNLAPGFSPLAQRAAAVVGMMRGPGA